MFCMYVRTFDVFKEDKGMSTKKRNTRNMDRFSMMFNVLVLNRAWHCKFRWWYTYVLFCFVFIWEMNSRHAEEEKETTE